MNSRTIEQETAFEKLKRLKVGALFMEMGTGKTRIAIELVDNACVDLLIYVTPFSTLNNIKSEFEKWQIKTPFILVGYESISQSDRIYLNLLNEIKEKKCFIIADESIFIKNEEAKRFKRMLELRSKCNYALILNGTPLTKSEWDLYNQMYFLSPKIINMSREQFRSTFFKKITYKKRGHREHHFYKLSEVNAKYLYKLIEPYMFRCELNFKKFETINKIYIEYIGEDYYKKKNEYLDEYLRYGNSDTIIRLLQQLNHISAVYSHKNDKLIKYIKGKRLIVFCNYIDELNYIVSKCNCYYITGDIKERHDIIEKFKNNNKPLIMTMGVGAYSLNLQFCNEIIYSSLNFDFGKFEQSKYRIKRIGQNQNINYTYFLTDTGINKLILDNLNRKITLNQLVKENMMKGDLKWIKNL